MAEVEATVNQPQETPSMDVTSPPEEEVSKKRSREEANETDQQEENNSNEDKQEMDDKNHADVIINPTTIFHLSNAPHLASTLPALTIPQTQVRNVLKKSLPGSCKTEAVYLVTKAAECFLTELLASATSVASKENDDSKKIEEESANKAPAAKKIRLTYDNLQKGFENLKQAPIEGVTPDLEFLDDILPKRTATVKDEETPLADKEPAADAPVAVVEEMDKEPAADAPVAVVEETPIVEKAPL